MSKPAVRTVKKAIGAIPVQIRKTVWELLRVKQLKHNVVIRSHYYGYYDRKKEVVVLGRIKHQNRGGAAELIASHIHEVLHALRPEWTEEVVSAMEHEYVRSRVLREASMLKLLNVSIFGTDPDFEAHQPSEEEWHNGQVHETRRGRAVRQDEGETVPPEGSHESRSAGGLHRPEEVRPKEDGPDGRSGPEEPARIG